MLYLKIATNVRGFAQAGYLNSVSPAVKPFELPMFEFKLNVRCVIVGPQLKLNSDQLLKFLPSTPDCAKPVLCVRFTQI
jgi:hypothetical protein